LKETLSITILLRTFSNTVTGSWLVNPHIFQLHGVTSNTLYSSAVAFWPDGSVGDWAACQCLIT